MKCHDIQPLMIAYLLDDLESSQRTEIDLHLANCPGCRGELDARAATVKDVRNMGDLPTSALRRERAVAGMLEEHRMINAALRPGGVRTLLRSPLTLAAAAVLAVVALFPILTSHDRSPATAAFRVTEARGRAFVHRPQNAAWEPLVVNDAVGEGSWIITEADGFLALEGTADNDRIAVDGNSSLKIDLRGGLRNLIIDKGQIYGKLSSAPYRIVDTNNDVLEVSRGEFEAGVRYAVCVETDEPEVRRKSLKQGSVASFTDAKVSDVVAALRKMVKRRIDPPAGIAGERRMTFHSDESDPEKLFQEFEAALERQGFALIHPDGTSFRLLPVSRRSANWTMARRIFVRMGEGSARLRGAKGEVVLSSGEEGGIDSAGYPVHKTAAKGMIAVWRDRTDTGAFLARNSIPMPSIELKYIGTADDGKPVVRYSLNASAITAQLGDARAEISISELQGETVKLDESTGEIIVPVRVRLALNK